VNNQRRATAVCMTLVFVLLSGLVFLRAGLVDHSVGTFIDCPGCFDYPVIMADLPMFSLAAGLLLLASLVSPGWLGRLLQALLGAVLLIYAIDLIVFRLFNSRLFMSDAALYVANPAAVWNQFNSGMGGWLPGISVLFGLLLPIALLAFMPPVNDHAQRWVLAAILLVSLSASFAFEAPPYVNDWAVDNVFAANLATSERVRYSATRTAEILASPGPRTLLRDRSAQGAADGRNVILIMLESWSVWHSELFGGSENWTPRLDAAAAGGLRFTNFHSIGFSTDKGLVGILAGQQIWASFLHWFQTPPFHSMWDVPVTLPKIFKRQNYHTAFLTTGPLGIYQKGSWLQNLGFDYVEGNEHPFYTALPRYAFEAASDQALFDRANQWRSTAQQPYLLVLETVTTHQPYIDPDSGKQSLEKAMKFADRAFGTFLESLNKSAFFEHGVLMVVSDHRSMTPIPAAELDAFGRAAHSRIPAFIIGRGFGPGAEEPAVFSQSDIVPTLEFWLNGEATLQPLQALMYGAGFGAKTATGGVPAQLNCAFHSRGDQRGLVEVLCNRGDGQVRLDGDNSRFTGDANLSDADRAQILQTLAVLRIEGLRRDELWQAKAAGLKQEQQ